MKIMYSHFQRYCYLLSDDDQKKVANAVEEIDTITKSIISLSSELDVYNTDDDSDTGDSFDTIHKRIIERIVKVTEFEDMYYNLIKNNLNMLSNLNNKS